jgi:hypothetical protein
VGLPLLSQSSLLTLPPWNSAYHFITLCQHTRSLSQLQKLAMNFCCKHSSCFQKPDYSMHCTLGPLVQLSSHVQLTLYTQ